MHHQCLPTCAWLSRSRTVRRTPAALRTRCIAGATFLVLPAPDLDDTDDLDDAGDETPPEAADGVATSKPARASDELEVLVVGVRGALLFFVALGASGDGSSSSSADEDFLCLRGSSSTTKSSEFLTLRARPLRRTLSSFGGADGVEEADVGVVASMRRRVGDGGSLESSMKSVSLRVRLRPTTGGTSGVEVALVVAESAGRDSLTLNLILPGETAVAVGDVVVLTSCCCGDGCGAGTGVGVAGSGVDTACSAMLQECVISISTALSSDWI